jgi:single-strand DNA-binding protein
MAKYGVNKVILVGNLGKDPELKYLDQGVAVAKFSLATTEHYKNREGKSEDRTEWHNIVLWRGLADVAGKFLKKGSTIYLEGRISNRSWVSPDGVKKYITEIEGDKMLMLDSKPADKHDASTGPFVDFPSTEVDSSINENDTPPF